jgi:transcriptional regulator of acetoin/glycerol metabolism
VSRDTAARLMQYHWPGNWRELQNVLEKAIVLTKGSVIEIVDLPAVKSPAY